MFISPAVQSSHYEWQIPHQACESASISLDQLNPVEAKPHLILHFDMNKTLIASDREGQKTAHDVVCAEIAGQVTDFWDDSFSAPISYADYVKHHLLPNPDHSKDIKLKQRAQISEVLQFLKERNHPACSKMQEIYDRAIGLLEKQETQIFKSFYRLIEFLQKENISYTLVIRTFGSEASEIAEELNERFGDDFLTDFRTLKRGDIQGTESNLYEVIANAGHHLVIRDDWEWWFEHGQHWKYGKPFPVDLSDPQRISLFFDDNAKVDSLFSQENIVYPYDAVNGKPIFPDELIKQGRLLPVEMLKALFDEDYYIRFVEKALDRP